MSINLKQLAQELDLDYSTVSYALSGKGSVSAATRARVREAADRLGYVPNGLVRRMRAKQTRTLGLVIPDTILLYNELIQQLYRGAAARGYELQIALTEFQPEAEERAVQSFLESRVDGMIIRSRYGHWDDLAPQAALRNAVTRNLPIVTYGPTLAGSPFPVFELPLKDRSRRAATHLLELGHRHLACLLPTSLPLFGPHFSAIEGMEQALKEWGDTAATSQAFVLAEDEKLAEVEELDGDYGNYLNEILPRHALNRGGSLLREALRLSPRPTGFVCYNAVTAIGALQEAQRLNLRVPEEIAIISIERSLVAELSPISLSTCDVPPTQAAAATLELLFEALAGEVESDVRRTLEPSLRIGDTTVVQPRRQPAASAVLLPEAMASQ